MKNVKFLAGALALAMMVVSCDKTTDVDNKAAEIKTTDVVAVMETAQKGELAGARDVNRPGSVLSWIETIDIKAQSGIDNSYFVEETYTMQDGTGAANIVLEDVALGNNTFYAWAKSYNQVADLDLGFWNDNSVSAEEVLAALRAKQPNSNFNDLNRWRVITEEGPNVVNFDMKAESGRVMGVFQLSDELIAERNKVSIRVTASAVGTNETESQEQWFTNNMEDKMTFYWSDNNNSNSETVVTYTVEVFGSLQAPGYDMAEVVNSWTREAPAVNGVSYGCIYTIGFDYVSEKVSDFGFDFNWDEVDCVDCPINEGDIIVSGDSPEMPELNYCDIVPGKLYFEDAENEAVFHELYIEQVEDNVYRIANGTKYNALFKYTNGTDPGMKVRHIGADSDYIIKFALGNTITYELKSLRGYGQDNHKNKIVDEGVIVIDSRYECAE